MQNTTILSLTQISSQVKDEVNNSNQYNQNFKGLYCTCKRPYPDPDDHVDDEMIQCVVCEDWFHGRVCFIWIDYKILMSCFIKQIFTSLKTA